MNSRRRESVRLPHPAGGSLQLDVSYPDAPGTWAVLYVHGLGSTRAGEKAQALEAACARRGWIFAAPDLRGHGESTGTLLELTGGGLLDDLALVRDYLASEGVRHVCPVGSSMGGWAAAWFTLRSPQSVPACVLLAPALDFLHGRWARLTEAEREDWKQTGRLRVRNEWIDVELGFGLVKEMRTFRPERLAAQLERPLLIFHGMRDDTIPYGESIAFAARAMYPEIEVRLFKDGDHRLTAHKDTIAETVCEFFARRLEGLPFGAT
jgi:pimeloyl-ACP methyl ester carboxylesterase